MVTTNIQHRNRITSIDALRAFALFGIMLLHSTSYFGYGVESVNDMSFCTNYGEYVNKIIFFLFEGRCNKIFAMLFGVSFYLILRNPDYSSSKFVWRCILLFVFGIINKIFYSGDVLMVYGALGIVLTLFRFISTRFLFVLFIIFFILGWYDINLFSTEPLPSRYIAGQSLLDVIIFPFQNGYYNWISSVHFKTLSYFVLGYYMAKRGIIEELPKYVNNRNIGIAFLSYAIFMVVYYVNPYDIWGGNLLKTDESPIKSLRDLTGSFLYSLVFLRLYYTQPKVFRVFESYGKLGLTNYSMMGCLGVVITLYIIFPLRLSMEYAIVVYVFIYSIQILFSNLWLNNHKFGPFEWLWRCLTSLEFTSNKKIIIE